MPLLLEQISRAWISATGEYFFAVALSWQYPDVATPRWWPDRIQLKLPTNCRGPRCQRLTVIENERQQWTEADFDALSWHDNELHGIRLHNPGNEYDFDLILDIDHILTWIPRPGGTFAFLVAPAIIAFHQVTNVECHLSFSYKEHITISCIDRERSTDLPQLISRWRWRIWLQPDASDPGAIAFDATGFTQGLTKPPIETYSQSLEDYQR